MVEEYTRKAFGTEMVSCSLRCPPFRVPRLKEFQILSLVIHLPISLVAWCRFLNSVRTCTDKMRGGLF